MFSLKQHVRRNASVVAVGAVALGLAAVAQAGFDWSGPGEINNDDISSGGAGIDTTDDVTFKSPGGTVTVTSDTYVKTLTFESGGYTLQGARILVGDSASTGCTFSQTAGSNRIDTTLVLCKTNPRGTAISMDIAANSDLYVKKILVGVDAISGNTPYGAFQKTGAGTLSLGNIDSNNSYVGYDIQVLAGTLHLSNTGNVSSRVKTISVGTLANPIGTLAGDGAINFSNDDAANFYGTLAPGAPVGFGDPIGTLTLNGSNNAVGVRFYAGSCFDIDLLATGEHDAFAYKCPSGGNRSITIDERATVKVNLLGGSFVEDFDYLYEDIMKITSANAAAIINGWENYNATDAITVLGLPSGLDLDYCQFVPAYYDNDENNNVIGLNLKIRFKSSESDVPEPASLALLGLGSGMLLLRRKR